MRISDFCDNHSCHLFSFLFDSLFALSFIKIKETLFFSCPPRLSCPPFPPSPSSFWDHFRNVNELKISIIIVINENLLASLKKFRDFFLGFFRSCCFRFLLSPVLNPFCHSCESLPRQPTSPNAGMTESKPRRKCPLVNCQIRKSVVTRPRQVQEKKCAIKSFIKY